VEVTVNENNVEHALRILKRKMQREGVYKDMKLHKHFEKPSVRKARKKIESLRRSRKLNRRRLEKEGY
jgi:small subunit ribosomal protein S21